MATRKPVNALIADAKKKDRAAFEELVQLYRVRLLAQIQARMGKKLRLQLGVEDILQETIVRAFEAIDKFQWRGEESFYRWLGSIAEHLIRNAAQKKSWSRLQKDSDFPAREASPSKVLRRKERFDRLERALNTLSGDQKKAITLARIEGLKVKEIAAKMKRSEDAIHKLLARAILGLRRHFGDTESFALPDRDFDLGDDRDEE